MRIETLNARPLEAAMRRPAQETECKNSQRCFCRSAPAHGQSSLNATVVARCATAMAPAKESLAGSPDPAKVRATPGLENVELVPLGPAQEPPDLDHLGQFELLAA